MNVNQNIMNNQIMMNLMNQMTQNSYQNNINSMNTNNQQNVMNNNRMMNYPTMGNMNNMNLLNMNANQNNNNMNYLTMNNSNQNNNNNNFMNMNQSCNMSNNSYSNLNNNINNFSMNNMDSNENNNTNSNNSNESTLIENLSKLSLNNHNESLYKEKPNYEVSEETKLILRNNQIHRGKLIANKKTISPTLQCAICMDLVMTPVECETCSKFYCKDCIDNWLKNSNECPNKHPFIKKEKLDDWVKLELGKTFLKCPYIGCGSDYAYKYWTTHVKNCNFKSKGVKKINNDNGEDAAEGGGEPFTWEKVQFFVKDIHDRTHTFMLPLSTTVRELKEKLEEKTGLKVEAQRLTCNGKHMDNPKMLEFYGLQNLQTIYQLARLKGGNKNITKEVLIKLNN